MATEAEAHNMAKSKPVSIVFITTKVRYEAMFFAPFYISLSKLIFYTNEETDSAVVPGSNCFLWLCSK
ncbi:hypothetical protein D3C86_1979690 [compost metagenome]